MSDQPDKPEDQLPEPETPPVEEPQPASEDAPVPAEEPTAETGSDGAEAAADAPADAPVGDAPAADALPTDSTSEQPDGQVLESAEDLTADASGADLEIDLGLLEAYLFTTHSPLTAGRLAELFDLESTKPIRKALRILNEQYEQTRRCFRVEQVAGGFQLLTLPDYGESLKALLKKEEDSKLTKAALETLAIIAYKQPILRAEVESIRGVASGETIRSLMEKHLVKIAGRAEEPGRPILYGTTKRFLEVFGLNSLKDLPQPEALQARAQQLAAAAQRLVEPEGEAAPAEAAMAPAETSAPPTEEPEQDVLGPGTNDDTQPTPESLGETPPVDETPSDALETLPSEDELPPPEPAEGVEGSVELAEPVADDAPSDEGEARKSDEQT